MDGGIRRKRDKGSIQVEEQHTIQCDVVMYSLSCCSL